MSALTSKETTPVCLFLRTTVDVAGSAQGVGELPRRVSHALTPEQSAMSFDVFASTEQFTVAPSSLHGLVRRKMPTLRPCAPQFGPALPEIVTSTRAESALSRATASASNRTSA